MMQTIFTLPVLVHGKISYSQTSLFASTALKLCMPNKNSNRKQYMVYLHGLHITSFKCFCQWGQGCRFGGSKRL